jgi:Chlorophyll A-B binding protein
MSIFRCLRAAAAQSQTTSSLQMADASKLIGGKPFGPDKGVFDPLGLAAKTTDIDLKRWQEAEVKHSRVAMLAVVGYLVQESFHPLFPVSYEIGPALRHFQIIER